MGRNIFMAKNVFFLYPHSVIQQELIKLLIAHEYSVYIVSDHLKLRALIGEYEKPIVFINIDDNLTEDEWIKYITEVMESDDNTASLGVLTYNENKELAQKYLMELMIPCGYITLKLGLEQSKSIILKTLEANEARGRRKYIRINCWEQANTEFNVQLNGRLYAGKIKDISSVGMAFVFNEDPGFQKHSVVSDIQLKLKGKIANVSGPIMGSRTEDGAVVYVLLFDKTTPQNTKERIHSLIYETLQEEIKLKLTKL